MSAVEAPAALRGAPILLNPEGLRPVVNRVSLIEPENGYYTGFQGLVRTEPLGLEYIAGAVTPLAHDVRIYDDRIKPGVWRERMRELPPDIVGIRCNYTADVPAVRKLAREVREELRSDVPIIIGGHHISLRPTDVFIPEVSAVVIGPGEKTFQNVVKAWASEHSLEKVPNIWYQDKDRRFDSNVDPKKISTRFTYNSPLMNERPKPRRDLVMEFRDGYYFLYYKGVYSVETARGCRYRCSFCSVWNFHNGEYDVESPNKTVAEIASLDSFDPRPSKYVNIIDDLAFSDIDAANEMADELLRLGINNRYWAQIRADNVWPKDSGKRRKHQAVFEKLAQAGLDMVLIGLESFDPKELKRVNKGSTVEQNMRAVEWLRDHGVKIWAAQIVFPNWDVSDFDKAIRINQELGVECPQFTILTPLPGTPDFDRAREGGQLLTQYPGDYDFFHLITPTLLAPEDHYVQISRLYEETTPFAKRPDGGLVSFHAAKRYRASVQRDIDEGRATRESVSEFTARFKDLQNADKHLAHLAATEKAKADDRDRLIFEEMYASR